jgi:hypothetical protein
MLTKLKGWFSTKGSWTVIWARLHVVLATVLTVALTLDPHMFTDDPKVITIWFGAAMLVSEMLRRRNMP